MCDSVHYVDGLQQLANYIYTAPEQRKIVTESLGTTHQQSFFVYMLAHYYSYLKRNVQLRYRSHDNNIDLNINLLRGYIKHATSICWLDKDKHIMDKYGKNKTNFIEYVRSVFFLSQRESKLFAYRW